MLTIKEVFWTYAAAGLSAVASLLLVRLFGLESRGEFAVLFASLSTVLSLATYHTLEASALLRRHTPHLKEALWFSILLSAVGIAYCLPHLSKVSWLLLIFAAAWALSSVISSSQLGILKGNGDVPGIGMVRAAFALVSLTSLIVISRFFSDVNGILFSYVVGNVAAVVVGMLLIKKTINAQSINQRQQEQIPKSLMALAMVSSILINIEPLLGTFIASTSEIGRYIVARSLFSVITPAATALGSKLYRSSISKDPVWRPLLHNCLVYFAALLISAMGLTYYQNEVSQLLNLSEPIGIMLILYAALISLTQAVATWLDEIFKGRRSYREMAWSGGLIVAIAVVAAPWLNGITGVFALGIIASVGRGAAIILASPQKLAN